MKKICAIMAAIMLLSLIPNNSFAETETASRGNLRISMEADADTSSKPSTFGTEAADGRVWTDKTVTVNVTDSDFDVTLSALAQEYKYTQEELSNMEAKAAADVLFILDFSTSMNTVDVSSDSGNISRFAAMTKAVNLAMQQIMTANKQNRVMICWYAGSNTTKYGTVVPLGSYCTTRDGVEVTDQDFFQCTGSGSSLNFSTVSTFKVVGGSTVSYNKSIDSGTRSQLGIAGCSELFIDATKTADDLGNIQRTPFVLYMTDGYATQADKDWELSASSLKDADVTASGSAHSSDTAGDKQVAALTILTAAVNKDRIVSHYNTLNTSAGFDGVTDLSWFNVGLAVTGVTDTTKARGLQIMLNPSYAYPSRNFSTQDVYYWLGQYTNNTGNAYHNAYRPTGSASDSYIYTDEGYVTYAQTGVAINNAFKKLGELVARLTVGTILPITNTTSTAESDNIFITFRDEIGDGTELVKNGDGAYILTLTLDGSVYNGTYNTSENKYVFSNGEKTLYSYATIDTNEVKWFVNALELPIIRFANRFSPGETSTFDGKVYANAEAEPIRLTYAVSPTDDALIAARAESYIYSNKWNSATSDDSGTAIATFVPKTANKYYYNGEDPKTESPVLKTANTTETSKYVSVSSWDTVNAAAQPYTIALGNNGRAELASVKVEYVFKNAPEGVTPPSDENPLTGEPYNAAPTEGIKKDGYTFSGWYTDENCTTPYVDGSYLTDDTKLYGKWLADGDFDVTKDAQIDGTSKKDGTVQAGSIVTYIIDVKNNNTYADIPFDFVDEVPEGLVVIGITISDGGVYDSATHKITWSNLTVDKGATKRVSFNATVPSDISENTDYVNKAYVTKADGEVFDGPGSKDDDPGTVSFKGIPRKVIKVEKVWSDTWNQHETDSVEVHLYKNDVLLDTINLTYGHQTDERTLASLDETGAPISYAFKEVYGSADLNEGESYGNYIVHYENSTDGNTETTQIHNNYKVKPDDITISKTADYVAEAGSQFTYTVSVTNTRINETASKIVVNDVVPSGLEIVNVQVAAEDSFNRIGQDCTWIVNSLPAQRTATMYITVKVPENASATEYKNKAKMISVDGEVKENETPEVKTDIRVFSVSKVWKDSSGNVITDMSGQPAVKVYLMQNGMKYDEGVVLDSSNNWKHTWTKIPISISGAEPYLYTVEEETVEGYSADVVYDETTKTEFGYLSATITNTQKAITVSYQYLGNTPEGLIPPEGGTYEYGTPYTSAEKPSQDYYTFEGWYTDPECTVPYTDGTPLNETTAPNGTLSLYGKWTHNTVPAEIVAPPDGVGPELPYPIEWDIDEGEPANPIPLEDPTGEYLFDGYYVLEEGELVPYIDEPRTQDNTPGGKLTLYPKWKKAIVVTYSFVGVVPEGVTTPELEKIAPGTVYTPKDVPDVTGFAFGGWCTDDLCEIPYVETELTENTDLYGKWYPVGNFTVEKDVFYNGQSIKNQSIYANHTVTYVLNIKNNNPVAAMSISFVDKVPDGLVVEPTSISDGGNYDQVNGTISWNITLANNESKRVSFNATIPATTSEQRSYNNIAYVSTTNGEPYDGPGSEGDNPGTVSFTGIPIKIMTISKSWSEGWDEHATETAAVNLYKNGELIRTLPFTYYDQSYVLFLDSLDEFGNEILYSFREVSVDDPMTDVGNGELNGIYRFVYTEDAVGNNVNVLISNVYQIQPDDLTFIKLAPETSEAGDYITYTLNVTNNRVYETATNIEIEDVLPEGLVFDSVVKDVEDIFTYDETTCRWTITTLLPGETAELRIIASIPEGTAIAEFENIADIVSIGDTICEPKESTPAVTTVRNFTVTKAWYGSDGSEIIDTSLMPQVTVYLMQNGMIYGEPVTLDALSSWTYTWEVLPLYDEYKIPYTYTVSENPSEGFTSTILYAQEEFEGHAYDTAALISNTRKTITVSYEYTGTYVPTDAKPPVPQKVDYGTYYNSVEKPTAPLSAFDGWYTDKECLYPYNEGTQLNDATVPTGTMTLYGKWSRESVDVLYRFVGYVPEGAIQPADEETPVNTAFYAKTDVGEPAQYSFDGWYVDPELTRKYTSGVPLYSDTALFGEWKDATPTPSPTPAPTPSPDPTPSPYPTPSPSPDPYPYSVNYSVSMLKSYGGNLGRAYYRLSTSDPWTEIGSSASTISVPAGTKIYFKMDPSTGAYSHPGIYYLQSGTHYNVTPYNGIIETTVSENMEVRLNFTTGVPTGDTGIWQYVVAQFASGSAGAYLLAKLKRKKK